MIKYIHTLLFISMISFSTYAQKSDNKEVVVEQEWGSTEFSSNKTLMENIKEMEEVAQILTVFEKGDLESISESEENLTIFIPLDLALDKMKRKDRKAFLEKTQKSELVAMWKNYVIPGRLDAYAIKRNIENQGDNSIYVRTLGNNQLEFSLKNGEIYVKDIYGNVAKWVKGDFYHKHGFFHFIDSLLYYETE